jgi:DNA-binding transcriptional regulator WhiA
VKPGRSFAAAARDEMARSGAEPSWAELSGLGHAAGSIHIRDGAAYLELGFDRAAVARRAYRVCRSLGLAAETWARRRRRPRPGNEYLVRVAGGPSLPLPRGRRQGRDFVRGLFMGAGSVSDPMAEHHLEIPLTDPAVADAAAAVLHRFGIPVHRAERRGVHLLYLKHAEQIAEFLRLAGAPAASFAYEEARILKDVRSRANRLVNADTANLAKAVEAGLRQAERLKALDLGTLPPALREVVELRLRHPDLSLRELGRLLPRPLGKSGVNHRLRAALRRAPDWLPPRQETL